LKLTCVINALFLYFIVIADPEYSAWLKFSAPYLYDILLNFVLVWPSLTVQWFPDHEEIGDITRHKILLGTQTTGETNHLMLCAIDISKKSKSSGNFRVLKRINHEGELRVYFQEKVIHFIIILGEIHRARYMPQDQDIIATKSPSKDVFVYKTSDYPEIPEDEIVSHTVRLVGHTKDG
jgi:histone-binding protein RBBP4